MTNIYEVVEIWDALTERMRAAVPEDIGAVRHQLAAERERLAAVPISEEDRRRVGAAIDRFETSLRAHLEPMSAFEELLRGAQHPARVHRGFVAVDADSGVSRR